METVTPLVNANIVSIQKGRPEEPTIYTIRQYLLAAYTCESLLSAEKQKIYEIGENFRFMTQGGHAASHCSFETKLIASVLCSTNRLHNRAAPMLVLSGTLRLSTPHEKRTAGRFNQLITDNRDVFRRYFGVDLFPGSLNIDVQKPVSLQQELDAGIPPPAFAVPKQELINMPEYIGAGQTWPCTLQGVDFPMLVSCWVFRRVGSQVPPGVIEIVAQQKLRDLYDLQHGDSVSINFCPTNDQ